MEYLPIIANLEGVPAHRAGTGNKQKNNNNGNSSKIFNGAEKRKLIPEKKSFALAVFFIQNHSV